MTDDTYRDSVLARLKSMENSIGILSGRLTVVETKNAVDEVHRQNVERRLTSIEAGLNKLLWLFGASLIGAATMFIISGGLAQ